MLVHIGRLFLGKECQTFKDKCLIQVGQHIGALDYLLPEEYVDTMKVDFRITLE